MTTALREKLKKDLIAIGNEVSHLWQHHDLVWRMTEITNKNDRMLEKGGDYLAWFKNSYIEAGSVGFRRQLDKDKRSISLINCLREIQDNSASFTREEFQKTITFSPGHNFHDARKWGEAGERFDEVFGNGGHLDSRIVQADMDLLETEGAAIKEQVNKDIAHRDRRGMQGDKATGEVGRSALWRLESWT